MIGRLKLLGALTIIGSFVLISCATTELTRAWKDSAYTGGPLKSVMVVGVAKNPARRKMYEDFFADQFQNNGIKAFPSGDFILVGKKLNQDTVKNQAQKLGVDAVLVTRLVGVEEKEEHIPASAAYVPGPQQLNLGRHYARVHAYDYNPGYSVTYKYVRLENNLYETKTEKLIWSSLSETVILESVQELIESLCKAVMVNLRKNNMIN